MTKTKHYKGTWRSERSEQKFRIADDERWAHVATTEPETITVSTRFGPTHVHHWPGPGADIVFLHGMGDTSVRWVPYAEALTEHNVYAIDTMGDPGGSIHEVGFTSAADYGTWLSETLVGLNLTEPHIAGHSMGGYIALSHATQGGRVSSLVLFEPVGVVKLRLTRFMLWNLMVVLAAFSPGPIRRWAAKRLRHPVLNDKLQVRALLMSQTAHPPKPPPLPVFTDEELTVIDAPIRLVVGEKSSAFKIAKMANRVTELFDDAHVHVAGNAGHALVSSHLDECLIEIRAAVTHDAASKPTR